MQGHVVELELSFSRSRNKNMLNDTSSLFAKAPSLIQAYHPIREHRPFISNMALPDIDILSSIPSSCSTLPLLLMQQFCDPFLLFPVMILLVPVLVPILNIRRDALWPSCVHPQCQRDETTPEHHLPKHPNPEQQCLPEHIQDLERDEYDHEKESDRREVGFLRELVDNGEEP